MKSNFFALVDSDAFVGWFIRDDAHFDHATALFARCETEGRMLATSSWVVAETATVLSHKSGQPSARAFLTMIDETLFPVIHVTEELQRQTVNLFCEQPNKNTSMTDCANVVILRTFSIPYILGFDAVYERRFGIAPLA